MKIVSNVISLIFNCFIIENGDEFIDAFRYIEYNNWWWGWFNFVDRWLFRYGWYEFHIKVYLFIYVVLGLLTG